MEVKSVNEFNSYLESRMLFLLKTKGAENIPLVELERAYNKVKDQGLEEAKQYFEDRMKYLRKTRGKEGLALIELERAYGKLMEVINNGD